MKKVKTLRDMLVLGIGGIWPKRGHASLNGPMSVTSIDIGKKYGFICICTQTVAYDCINTFNG